MLDADRIALLESLSGWTWAPREDEFRSRLALFKTYVDREGHAEPRADHVESSAEGAIALERWVCKQRDYRKAERLSAHRIEQLEEVRGWTWDPKQDAFLRGLRALTMFVEREGHTRPPRVQTERIDGRDIRVGEWATNYRHHWRKGTISPEHAKLLSAVPSWISDSGRLGAKAKPD